MYISPVNNCYFNNISFARKKIPVYAIDSKGNYERFDSRTEAAKKLDIAIPDINRSAAKRFHKAKGYLFVNADKLEKINKNGEIEVHQKDIDEIIAYRTLDKGIYAIDKKGNYRKFNLQSDASKELGLDRKAISGVLSGGHKTAQGYFFVHANKLESKDENGNIVINEEKIKELISDKPLHPIYAIDRQGNYIKFPNQLEASIALGVSRQRINQVIGSNNNSCNGYYIVQADMVESKDKDGKVLIDEAKIEEILIKKAILTRSRSSGAIKKLYAIDSKGNYRKFNSRQEASEVLGIPAGTITNTVTGCQKTTHGLALVNAREIEKVSENKEFVVDDEKLQKVLKQRFPKTIFLS